MKLINGHLNTTFSFLESCIQANEAIKKAKENGMEYLCITEHTNFFSMPLFIQKCSENNIKPIFGLDIDLMVDQKLFRYILLPVNKKGFDELSEISYQSLSGKSQTLSEIILFKNIYIIEHPLYGFYALTKQVFEFQNYYYSFQFNSIQSNKDFIKSHVLKSLIINHNIISEFEDNDVLKVLRIMKNQEEKDNYIFDPLEFDFECNNELQETLIKNTNILIKNCYFEFKKQEYILPKFKNDKNISSEEYLLTLIKQKLVKVFKKEEWTKEYEKRLQYELSIINKLKFADYFLIIQDWINWAKNNDIAIGPGRGSSSGSLVSYILGITEVDPLKYGLIFERFLNPERVSMPDIDTDVQDDRRQEVIKYLVNKYGFDNVANIVTFSALGKKSAIRDVMRAYNVSPIQINLVSKTISNDDISLLEEYKKNKRFAIKLNELNPNDSEFANKIVNVTSKLEGFYRQTGTHAAGVVIGAKKIKELVPTYKVDDEIQQTQISMEYLEEFGLLKMDVLGLKTLTTIKEIVAQIEESRNIKIDLSKIPYDDHVTFKLLTNGNTIGVFQLESYGMIKTLKEVKVNKFEDIVAIISLFRPGPMENLHVYAKRKEKLEVIPQVTEKYDEVVKDTYGIIIYQEQIMQICQVVANMTFAEADNVRRIISKKKLDEMQAIKINFISRAIKNGYSSLLANQIYENIEKFAEYGFNKSHAVSYAITSYQMAYLKAHYPLEFYTAIISSAHGTHETIFKYVEEAKRMGISILSPDINLSKQNATVYNNKIILPFTMIKGLGPETIKLIVSNRDKIGKYTNFLHMFVSLLSIKSFGIANIELLIKSNALRSFGFNQATLLNEIDKDNSDLRLLFKVKKTENSSLFDYQEDIKNYQPTEILETNTEEETKNEIDLLGNSYNFSITSQYEKVGTRLADMHIGNEYLTILYCSNVIKRKSKSSNRDYYIVDLQDSTDKISIFVYANKPELLEIKNKIIQVTIIKTLDKYILRNWRIINEG
ncbi:DNA polymerase III subunit alpha [Metamycoplasma buccale]|uniref:DNA polymerase III subunit alpha n=1 Tax=Metamycoplasma buccale TaxID=55602 RepID=UPI00398F7C82